MNYPQLCSPRKILLTTDTIGGVWTYALELTRTLGEHDVQVALATMGAPLSREQRKDVPN
jgi:glycogen synthase